MSRAFSLILFVLAVVLIGMLIGYATLPGEWYASLNKPSFTPPNWIFAPVWTVLYISIAIAGWRCWVRDRNSTAMKLWFVQMSLNFLWSPVFFGAQQPGMALVVVIAALAAVLTFIAAAWNSDRLAAVLFLPYAAWTAFATALTAGVVFMN
ncbi:TspO/MBR family protein [Aminobacter sp. MET-1]|uniref:TspO/MBR family protein n=1 Tax=Aminobacter sp. MET-1 TaxID=2951085 RepID=UPI00226A4A53|nr:TspO/MBR family protein [Aminobacter sp. MET-1]MCX8570886.1 tryptophan-rich sensory protein [Aminobacter sp. MET-1]